MGARPETVAVRPTEDIPMLVCVGVHGGRPCAENAHDDRPSACLIATIHIRAVVPVNGFASRPIQETKVKPLMIATATINKNKAIFARSRRQ